MCFSLMVGRTGRFSAAIRRLSIGLLGAAAITPACHARPTQPPPVGGGVDAPSELDLVLDRLATDPVTRVHGAIYDLAMRRTPARAWRSPSYPPDVIGAVREATRIMANPAGRSLAGRGLGRGNAEGRAEVARAIASAARATGVSTTYLWRTAKRESGLNPLARSQSSTARGLFQFVEQTWLTAFLRHGRRHGLILASTVTPDGLAVHAVHDSNRERILQLRDDPWIAARLAGELANDNRRVLERALGRQVSDDELYVAHFLGSGGAVALFLAAAHTPATAASTVLPTAAAANPAVFFSQGRPVSAAQLVWRLRHG